MWTFTTTKKLPIDVREKDDDGYLTLLTNIMLIWPISNKTNIELSHTTFPWAPSNLVYKLKFTKFHQLLKFLQTHFHKILSIVLANILQVVT